MTTEAELVASVDAAFRETGRGFAPWPDPHPDRSVLDEEYSRLTDPQRWRIVGARVDAWFTALTEAGLADVHRDDATPWAPPVGPAISRTDRVVPRQKGAIPLVVARTALGDVGDAGVLLGVGDPAQEIERFPDCGCDACDSGSQDELDHLDAHLLGVVTGGFRRLSRAGQIVTTLGDGGWSVRSSGRRRAPKVDEVLADPRGWDEVTGADWR